MSCNRVTVAPSARSNASSRRSSVRDRRTRFDSFDTVDRDQSTCTRSCTIERIAIELGYASDTALRNTIKRYTGQRAGQIRNAGGVDAVVAALEARALRGGDNTRLRLL